MTSNVDVAKSREAPRQILLYYYLCLQSTLYLLGRRFSESCPDGSTEVAAVLIGRNGRKVLVVRGPRLARFL